jgi:hypothetical protein
MRLVSIDDDEDLQVLHCLLNGTPHGPQDQVQPVSRGNYD